MLGRRIACISARTLASAAAHSASSNGARFGRTVLDFLLRVVCCRMWSECFGTQHALFSLLVRNFICAILFKKTSPCLRRRGKRCWTPWPTVNAPLPESAQHRALPFQWRSSCLIKQADDFGVFTQSLTPNRRLCTPQDYAAFQQQLSAAPATAPCISFPNLSGDTVLVVPTPVEGKTYTTLREFLQQAPTAQQRALWKEVARQARAAMNKHEHVWISTHGLGVAFLHVRICSHPKYYNHSALQHVSSPRSRRQRPQRHQQRNTSKTQKKTRQR